MVQPQSGARNMSGRKKKRTRLAAGKLCNADRRSVERLYSLKNRPDTIADIAGKRRGTEGSIHSIVAFSSNYLLPVKGARWRNRFIGVG
jgi:hypothetical protein